MSNVGEEKFLWVREMGEAEERKKAGFSNQLAAHYPAFQLCDLEQMISFPSASFLVGSLMSKSYCEN